jgi:RimJ/RimL family protein N-acetyltransferase
VNNPFLIGFKIYLRPLERDDARTVMGWLNDPEVRRTLQVYRPISLKAEEEFIDKLGQNDNAVTLGIAVKATDKLIGVTGLKDIDFKNRHAGFGIALGEKDEWGKGYGTEATRLIVGHAFGTLNLNRVWLHVYQDNERGLRTYQRVGFKQEGLLRQEIYRAGRYWDTILMSILRQEWEEI